MKDLFGATEDTGLTIDSGLGHWSLSGNQPHFYLRFGKRMLDLAIVLSTLCITLSLILVCAAITALDGGAPFYAHKRIGLNGREFRCWKVRSMVADSAARLESHLAADPAARAEWDSTRKLRNDPRVTPFGRFLRKSSLDELPQILNVLLGEMSVVGPRPVVQEELALYGIKRQVYLTMRPGLTGLWQISGRNDVSYAARVALDQEYRQTFSLRRDLSIVLRTFGALIKRTGC